MPHDIDLAGETFPDVPAVMLPTPDGELVPYLDPDDFVRKDELPQSDWEEKDETSPSFIKNKPFYDEFQGGTMTDFVRVESDMDTSKPALYLWDHSQPYGYMSKTECPYDEFNEDILEKFTGITYGGGARVGDQVRAMVVYAYDNPGINPAIRIDVSGNDITDESQWRTLCFITFNEGKGTGDPVSYPCRVYDDDHSWDNPIEIPYTGFCWIWYPDAGISQHATISLAGEGTTVITHQIDPKYLPDTGVNMGKFCEYIGKEFGAFRRGIAIGDSLTEGNLDLVDGTGNKSIGGVYSFPTLIEKMTGVPVYNAGIAGATVESWINAATVSAHAQGGSWGISGWEWNLDGDDTLDDEMSNHYDFAIINIGYNDHDLNPDPTEEDLNNFHGAVDDLIEYLQEKTPYIRIFLCTFLPCFANLSWQPYRNQLMKFHKPSEGVWVLDLYTYSNTAKKTDYNTDEHMTALGYQKMAEEIVGYISYTMATDKNDYFKSFQFVCGTQAYGQQPMPYFMRKWLKEYGVI